MKLFSYYDSKEHSKTHLGLYTDSGYINVEETVRQNKSTLPTTLEELYHSSKPQQSILEEYQQLVPVFLDPHQIQYAPSVPTPGKILCVGLNYNSHIEETGMVNNSQFPPLFSKFTTSLLGHNQTIHLPEGATEFDYEAELVIVMGKVAKHVSPKDALSYVYGYSIGNDFSARDLQMSTSQWLLGKACDDFAPLGPYLVTADEVDPDCLEISCKVNGITRQSSNTKNMIFSCAKIISYISNFMTLQPGDIIYTGTPEGVILGYEKENQSWLKPGDQVSVTIEHLGVLSNTLK